MADYSGIKSLWELNGKYVDWMMNRKAIENKMNMWPGLFLVDEEQGNIVAVAVGGFEGQFGNIGHLAVHTGFQGQGRAKSLIAEIEKRLKEKGALTCYVLTKEAEYFKALGFSGVPETFLTKRL